MSSVKTVGLVFSITLVGYLFFWPVAIEPISWTPAADKGLVEDFSENSLLSKAQIIELPGKYGPEDIAIDAQGVIYTGTDDGTILKIVESKATGDFSVISWLNTGGRALGMEFDKTGNLIVADAELGLLSIDIEGNIKVLADEFNNKKLSFVDDLDIADDGRIFFSDASAKFSARDFGGAVAASKVDINEHGGHGRVFVFDPRADPNSDSIQQVAQGLNFANGIAVSFDQRWVLVNESGSYRILKFGIAEDNFGEQDIVIDNLPGFPDNITRGKKEGYWFGLVSQRNVLLDASSDKPWLRKIAQRMPKALQPKASRYAHVALVDEGGQVLKSLQGPELDFGFITGAIEYDGYLYLTSLHEGAIARIKKNF